MIMFRTLTRKLSQLPGSTLHPLYYSLGRVKSNKVFIDTSGNIMRFPIEENKIYSTPQISPMKVLFAEIISGKLQRL